MNEFLTYEFTVHQKTEGFWIAKKIALILFYVIYVITTFSVGILSKIFVPFLALVPLTLWIIIFFTWRYVNVDYECSMTSGVFTFSKVFGSRSRKKMFETSIKGMAHIAPYKDDCQKLIDRFAPEVIYDARSSVKASPQYFALFENENGKKALFIFEGDEKCLNIIKFYNSSAVISEKKRVGA